MFFCEYCGIFKNGFLYVAPPEAASENSGKRPPEKTSKKSIYGSEPFATMSESPRKCNF